MKRIIFFLILLFFLSSCGKKQKNIFDFTPKKEHFKVNRLDLCSIKNLKIQKNEFGNFISWKDVDYKSSNSKIKFLGFNVYRLVKSLIIPKKPLNDSYIKNNFFLDKEVLKLPKDQIQKNYYYVVNAIFDVDGVIVKGPLSQVACTN